ncbi:helix-turn-helix transcriptional regulator [Pseudoflavitalea sp. G-6-1-2]|uniref:winged helix-turn-helix transcriptional regulator n=1 Tax=Pseudoflavitalea sp. G-6-1-2 TaxID=2728841 RepID=UPI00146C54BC|nr:helix-turn-helix domain-containing protein [Pseudoflavitalea sp. G-6-1-2]NML22009.1 helix-turn-helix transcriptional regulator [Pseudoflavitalea sp. G-6-1-2]
MTAVKQSSVIQENKSNAFAACPVTFVMERIGGYWKPIILFNLLSGTKRYNELKKSIPAITEKVLIQQLKQLETDGLIIRKSKPVVPPYVTYQLSRQGKELRPVLHAMALWAVGNGGKQSRQFSKQMEDFPVE